MKATFALSAIPHLLREGENKGHLQYVTFIATDGIERHTGSLANVGTYAEDFALIVDAGYAVLFMERLHNSETVLFPGLFARDQIQNCLGGFTND
jgi:hypothetical protein